MSKRRKTSALARVRGLINLTDLIVAGYISLGSQLRYEYQGQKFHATVVSGGYLVADDALNGASSFVDRDEQNRPRYVKPTNWTEDCIRHYNLRLNRDVKTRASPYARVTLADANGPEGRVTLQKLQARYIEEFVGLSPVETPDAIREAVQRRLSRLADDSIEDARSSSSSSSDSSVKMRASDFVSVQKLRDGRNRKSYREISFHLESLYNTRSRLMRETDAALIEAHRCLELAKSAEYQVRIDDAQKRVLAKAKQRMAQSNRRPAFNPPGQRKEAQPKKRSRMDVLQISESDDKSECSSVSFDTSAHHTVFSSLLFPN